MTDFKLNITELMSRVVALEKEAMATVLPAGQVCGAVPYFIYSQDTYPYFTNRDGAGTSVNDNGGGDISEELDHDTYTVIMRLIIGHVTEGYVGDLETTLHSYIPTVKTYFNSRGGLQSATYPDALVGIRYARIINWTGLRVWQTAGINALQMGNEFTLHCELDEQIIQAYT